VDAFNPLTEWYDNVVLGIDVGITMVMAENHRSKFVWHTFMKNGEARVAMARTGFRSEELIEEEQRARSTRTASAPEQATQ
jgi:hypothetical protein